MRSTKIATRQVRLRSVVRNRIDTSCAASTAIAYSRRLNDDASTTSTAYERGRALPSSTREHATAEAGPGLVCELGGPLDPAAVFPAPPLDGMDQRLDAGRVELDAGLVPKLVEGDFLRQRLPVGARRGHGVVRVGDHHDV